MGTQSQVIHGRAQKNPQLSFTLSVIALWNFTHFWINVEVSVNTRGREWIPKRSGKQFTPRKSPITKPGHIPAILVRIND